MTRTVTYNLSHVTSSNTASSVDGGSRYTTTLTATGNYTLNSVTVTMGGVDITSTAYSSGTITIPSVTGNMVITASAVLSAESITATYTQSGTVYDTDTLDSLKADLVVTANYAGGTSETVTEYTLSGTLTVGTSTITVEYAGLTATFNVTVAGKIYCEFDANGTPTGGAMIIASYKDDGETETGTITEQTCYLVNHVFTEDTDVTFHLEASADLYRMVHVFSADMSQAVQVTKTGLYGDVCYRSMTAYRTTSLYTYYTEGTAPAPQAYVRIGNIYDGTYTVKAGCMFGIRGLQDTPKLFNDEKTVIYYYG